MQIIVFHHFTVLINHWEKNSQPRQCCATDQETFAQIHGKCWFQYASYFQIYLSFFSKAISNVTTSLVSCERFSCCLCYILCCYFLTTNHPDQLSLPSQRGRLIEYWLAWLGLKQGTLTCVWWKNTLIIALTAL